jgi:hypothetical protein
VFFESLQLLRANCRPPPPPLRPHAANPVAPDPLGRLPLRKPRLRDPPASAILKHANPYANGDVTVSTAASRPPHAQLLPLQNPSPSYYLRAPDPRQHPRPDPVHRMPPPPPLRDPRMP